MGQATSHNQHAPGLNPASGDRPRSGGGSGVNFGSQQGQWPLVGPSDILKDEGQVTFKSLKAQLTRQMKYVYNSEYSLLVVHCTYVYPLHLCIYPLHLCIYPLHLCTYPSKQAVEETKRSGFGLDLLGQFTYM
jgi:hypothetical protein